MIAISKIDDQKKFHRDMLKGKRKTADEIWFGEPIRGITDIIRFAPSACNIQPWFVEHRESILNVHILLMLVQMKKRQSYQNIVCVDK